MIAYKFYRYGTLYTREFDTIKEALENAVNGELEGALSSFSFEQDGKMLWQTPGFGCEGGIFDFAEENGVDVS